VNENVGGNALKLVGEILLPGGAQLLAGNVKSGLTHTVIGVAAGAVLVGTGIAPLLGTLTVLGVKLNSFSSSVGAGSLWAVGSSAIKPESKAA
jgi:hypothetical protein